MEHKKRNLSRREVIAESKSPHCTHWRSTQNRPLLSKGNHTGLTLARLSRMRSASDRPRCHPEFQNGYRVRYTANEDSPQRGGYYVKSLSRILVLLKTLRV
ncbi:hypothetical protein TNCV_4858861 [Trichonephila clavipes]|nr:hypothetical protein TNCV_4858861 [Trichonephila clavipes]